MIFLRPSIPLRTSLRSSHVCPLPTPSRTLRTLPPRLFPSPSQPTPTTLPSPADPQVSRESFLLRHLPARLRPYWFLSRIDKPIGTWLLYWPCAWSITLASAATHQPLHVPAAYCALFGVGALVMRGAGCVINDLWDRRIDAKVERTKLRPLASGEVRPFQALSFLGIQLSAGLAVLTQLNWYSILLGASSLSLVALYPLMKRITYWPQAVLGLAFNWGALLGWSAISSPPAWSVVLPLYAGSFCWTLVYDTIYAHQDKSDDVHAGVKSTALLFGHNSRPILAGFSTAFVGLLAAAGWAAEASLPFYLVGCGGAAAHLAWQLRGVDFESRVDCWSKFCSNARLGGIVWAGTVADYAVRVGPELLG